MLAYEETVHSTKDVIDHTASFLQKFKIPYKRNGDGEIIVNHNSKTVSTILSLYLGFADKFY